MANFDSHENRKTHRFNFEGEKKFATLNVENKPHCVALLNYSAGGFLVEVEADKEIPSESGFLITDDEEISVELCHQILDDNETRLQIGLKRIKSVPREEFVWQQLLQHTSSAQKISFNAKSLNSYFIAIGVITLIVMLSAITYRSFVTSDPNNHWQQSIAISSANSEGFSPGHQDSKTFTSPLATSRTGRNLQSRSSRTSSRKEQTKRKFSSLLNSFDLTQQINKTNQQITSSVPRMGISNLLRLDSKNVANVNSLLQNWASQHQGEPFVFQFSENSGTSAVLTNVSLKIDFDSLQQLSLAIQKAPENWETFLSSVEQYVSKNKHKTASSFSTQATPLSLPKHLLP